LAPRSSEGIRLAPVHPGGTIKAELAARCLSAHRAALKMRMPPNRLALIINGRRGVTADTALRLARLFGTGPLFWVNLQAQYDLAVAERDHGARITAEVEAA
jgi:addiction module HigA family antidote